MDNFSTMVTTDQGEVLIYGEVTLDKVLDQLKKKGIVKIPFPFKPNKEIQYMPPTRLSTTNKHVLILGISGSGKTMTLETMIVSSIGKDKVIDIFDETRTENFTFGIKENDPKMLRLINDLNRGYIESGKKIKGKAYTNEIIMIVGKKLKCFDGGWINRLPKKIKIMSLDPDDLTLQDLIFLLGTNEKSKTVLKALQYEVGKKNIKELEKILKDKELTKEYDIHPMQAKSLLMDIRSLLESGMFESKVRFKSNVDEVGENGDVLSSEVKMVEHEFPPINWDEMLNDKKKITSFSTYLLQTDMDRATFLGIAFGKIIEWKTSIGRGWGKHRVKIGIREVSRMGGKDMAGGYEFPHFLLKYIIEQGRDIGIDVVADTQYPTHLIPRMRSGFSLWIVMRSHSKVVEGIEQVVSIIPKNILEKIPNFDIGTCIVIDSKSYYTPIKIPPTRHHHKREGEDIFKLLAKGGGKNSGYQYFQAPLPPEVVSVEEVRADMLINPSTTDGKIIPEEL